MVLYDFIYKNKEVIESFYAQMFDGLLMKDNIVKEIGSDEDKSKSVGYSSSSLKNSSSSHEKEAVNREKKPHDAVTIDTLSILSKNAKDIKSATNGEIVKIPATVFFLDKALFDTLLPNLFEMMSVGLNNKEKKEAKKFFNLINTIFKSIRFDPLCFMYGSDFITIGTIKEELLQEPISSYHLKHGRSGLSDVFIIGIKEENTNFLEPKSDLQGGALEIVEGIKNSILPNDAYVVAPIAIYREIEINDIEN